MKVEPITFDCHDEWLAALLLARGVPLLEVITARSGTTHYFFEYAPAFATFLEVHPAFKRVLALRDDAHERGYRGATHP